VAIFGDPDVVAGLTEFTLSPGMHPYFPVVGYIKYLAAGEQGLSEVPVTVLNKWLMPAAKKSSRMKTS